MKSSEGNPHSEYDTRTATIAEIRALGGSAEPSYALCVRLPLVPCLILLLALPLAGCGDDPDYTPVEPEVTFAELLGEMTAREAWLEPPAHAFRSRQQSSQEPGGDDPNADAWWNNRDKGYFRRIIERNGRREAVMMEERGSGAIVRIWSATPLGTLRVYIDGATEPVIEEDMEALLSGAVEPFGAPFAYVTARGHNLYFPIPFQHEVIVTTDVGWERDPSLGGDGLLYYHVGYRLYDAPVESFTGETLTTYRDAIAATAAALEDPTAVDGDVSEGGAELTLDEVAGGVINELRLTTTADNDALRGALIVMECDGEETIRAPVSDFFGSGAGRNPHRSIVTEVSGDDLIMRFPMPFAESATVRVEGLDDARLTTRSEAYPFGPNTRYFRSGFRGYNKLSAEPKDLEWLEVTGEGVYVGNTATYANPDDVWWGEGDERIYVDDDAIGNPSFGGTGTEDYYGYAWIMAELFSVPYHGQVATSNPEGKGVIALHRFHIIDAIPFTERFRFVMELWHWHPWVEVDVESVHYFYGRDTVDDLENLSVGEITMPDLSTLNSAR